MSDKTARRSPRKAALGGEAPDGKKGKTAARREDKAGELAPFPFGGLLLLLFLVAFILTASYYGLHFMERRDALKAFYESRIASAEAVLAAAGEEYAEADPDSAEHAAERRLLTEEMIAAAERELSDLEQKAAETDAAVRSAQERIAALESGEDYDYFMSVYEEYLKGRAYVEALLSGD